MVYSSEERIGVYSVAKIFTEDLGWIFREQPINDFGIDGFVEITRISLNLKDRIPIGKLIGVQIKSGKSFFKEESDNHFVFRGSIKHLYYWINHSIPVILILYDKEARLAYWEEVNKSTVLFTGKGFKVNISKRNLVDIENAERLKSISFFKNRSEYKLWQLQTSIEEIRLLISETLFLYIEIDGIPNSNDYHITLLLTDENCENHVEIIYRYEDENSNRFDYFFYLSKETSLKEAINDILPWADLFIDGVAFSDELLTETILSEILSLNQEEFTQDVLEFKEKNLFLSLATYLCNSYYFKLELKANDLAYTFLSINDFLSKEPVVRQRIFL
ncbi:DUF4365 domain-containing protein [Flavisolibacter ginsenosidimutans]|uniref:DUF4365 domain-containing protein n=1 Tax=Flavisolibacter ginsenosidimutans TaxID=661481 RepID=A0A5B8ULK1_9BACT|nr:DUF4365 domain-containing protein [Flavisolibacter ginsenosidimutans]QEC56930.1 DUF4365 domain-containing protein [Flavisolibacter ginsenosidimutans]